MDNAIQAKQKSDVELLREVLESYGPEDFFTASLNPKIFRDEKTKKAYVQVIEKFNQTVFWDEFLPKLRKALDGVAVKKSKQFYADDVRKANQTLTKQGYTKRKDAPRKDSPYESGKTSFLPAVLPWHSQ